MKIKQLKELQKKTKEELLQILKETKQKISLTHLEILHGKVKNTRTKKSLRKDIAQILTIININQASLRGTK